MFKECTYEKICISVNATEFKMQKYIKIKVHFPADSFLDSLCFVTAQMNCSLQGEKLFVSAH